MPIDFEHNRNTSPRFSWQMSRSTPFVHDKECLGVRPLPTADVDGVPVVSMDGSQVSVYRSSCERDIIINRLLDWAEEARSRGREQRSEELTLLAWEAYERLS